MKYTLSCFSGTCQFCLQVCFSIATFLFAVLIATSAVSAETGSISKVVLSHAGDFTFGYYPKGWNRAHQIGSMEFAVQTNHYGLVFDPVRAKIERMGPLDGSADAAVAAAQGNDLLNAMAKAELVFGVIWEGRVLSVTSGAGAPDQMRLYHVGKYLQHFLVPTMQVGGLGAGAGMDSVNAWMEGYCWSDRFALEAHYAWYANQLGVDREWKDVSLAALLTIPPEFPIIEVVGNDGTWRGIQSGEQNPSAILMRNEAGAGIALLCIPGLAQRARVFDDGRLGIESEPFSFRGEALRDFPCVVIPSNDVRKEALRELRQMQAALEGQVRIVAKGLAPYTGPLEARFDPAKGWWQVQLEENHDPMVMERVHVELNGRDEDAMRFRLNFSKIGGGFPITGMSPVLRDRDGFPTGLPVQISKNWHCTPPWFNGITVVDTPDATPVELEFDLAYAFWGGVPAVAHAQLCLVGWGTNQLWDQMAIGSFGESICYDPDVNLNRSMIDDMRPLMVWAMGDQPRRQWSWTHNVGGGDFLVLFTGGRRQFLTRQKTLYSSYGPVMSDVSYLGQTADGAIQSNIRTQSWRVDDYVRALYTLEYRVEKPVEGIERLAFFQLGADHYNDLYFDKLARGSAEGMQEEWEPPKGGGAYSRRGEPLSGTLPWIGMYGMRNLPQRMNDGKDQGAMGDKAVIVRSWRARLGGRVCLSPFYSIYGSNDGGIESALVELSPPAGLARLEPGDYVEAQIEVMILPQKADDYYGPNEALRKAMAAHPEPWALTLREASGSNVTVAATVGKVEGVWPIRIRAENGAYAEFNVTGGIGYTPVTIVGAQRHRDFILQEKMKDGTLVRIDQSSDVGNDWWQADFRPASQDWDLTFTLPLDMTGGEPRIRNFVWKLDAGDQ